MTDPATWTAVDRPLLEATALLCSQGQAPDDRQVGASVPAGVTHHEVLVGLKRLIGQGFVSGNAIGAWQATGPVRVVNLNITAAGLAKIAAAS